MFKKLWKLVSSEERVMQALEQNRVTYDLSPDMALIPANDEVSLMSAHSGPKPKLWLEDWSEKDEERLKRTDHHWEGYVI